ncbi:TIGR03667 family PPOX class F420-dependent oxidoreductase [Nocardia sp. NPDC059177]|uniref:TIGR03667 family PPOX class F420-dependent oxidoreductase n=1 Tax=Nocardia sp. NPDC059177 TaxID=3346759 RepID=UPI0036B6DCC9
MSVLDESTPFGATVARRLADDHVIWLTTIAPSGTPQPNPVWFLWRAGEFLLFTQPGTPKLRNIAANPRVSLNLNSTASGGDVAVFTGTAQVGAAADPEETAAYVRKYTQGFVDIKMTEAEFFADYSVPVHITPDRLRGF